ncbi:DUF1828 domain-containing protein [Staphylococcus borealis]|uniref:DUF1828 domain-containing protein n=1 Tax=Staphylococcus borealis TaxID=2742203 RepID=UPI00313403B5
MCNEDIKTISNDYYEYLKNENNFIPLQNKSIEFYSPVIDYFGDSISVNIQKQGEEYYVTDYGETLWNLKEFGIDLLQNKQSKNYHILSNILNDYDLLIEDKKIYVKTNKKQLSQSLHDFIQAISDISNLAILKKDTVKSLFKEEVIDYFLANKRLFPNIFPEFKVEGKSKLIHSFVAVFPGETTQYVQTLKNINTNSAKNILFDWEDVSEYRSKHYDTNAKLNLITENKKDISSQAYEILNSYGVNVLSFDDKHSLEKQFGIAT